MKDIDDDITAIGVRAFATEKYKGHSQVFVTISCSIDFVCYPVR